MLNYKTRLGYLLGVGVLFYVSYGLTNYHPALRENVPEIVFAWEQHIPFVAWTIVPYWSLNLLYALAFFLSRNRTQLRHYVARLLLAQAIAVAGFLLFPLQITWQKPETSGVAGFLFESLAGFDQPYNQAPSLHIILTIVVGAFYWRHFPKWRIPLCLWFGLIALSILTTYQHHFLDLPTGAVAGFGVLWLLPENQPTPIFAKSSQNLTACHYRLIRFYLLGTIVCIGLACLGGGWLWCLWAAIALGLVAMAYWRGVAIFQKRSNGKLTAGSTALCLPYLLGARLNIVYWLQGKAKSAVVCDGVFVGSIVVSRQFDAVLDCCAELPCCELPSVYEQALMLDLVPPSINELCQAARKLDRLQAENAQVLVACALGYGRSVAVVLTWLLATGRAPNLEQAINTVKRVRPKMVISHTVYERIELASQQFHIETKNGTGTNYN